MKRARVGAVVGLVLVLGLGAAAFADTVTKTDGTVIEGEITAESDDSVTIKCKLGELKVPRSEVTKVERTTTYDPDPELDELRRDTLKVLADIRAKAETWKLEKKAHALDEIARSVKAWTLKEGRSAAPISPNLKAGTVNYDDFLDGYAAAGADPSLTAAQSEAAKADYLKKFDGKTARYVGALSEAVPDPPGAIKPRLWVRLLNERHSLDAWVEEPTEIEKIGRAPKGSLVACEGKLSTKGAQPTLIWGGHFSLVK